MNPTSKTLYNIVDSIQVSRVRLSACPLSKNNKKPWTKEEEHIFYKVIDSLCSLYLTTAPI